MLFHLLVTPNSTIPKWPNHACSSDLATSIPGLGWPCAEEPVLCLHSSIRSIGNGGASGAAIDTDRSLWEGEDALRRSSRAPLPIKSRCRFSCVSKACCDLIIDRRYLNHFIRWCLFVNGDGHKIQRLWLMTTINEGKKSTSLNFETRRFTPKLSKTI